jgi:hypothetical protein
MLAIQNVDGIFVAATFAGDNRETKFGTHKNLIGFFANLDAHCQNRTI